MTLRIRLDGSTPRTHAGDPCSSHLAEARNRSGRGPVQMASVLALVRRNPGSTASHLATIAPGEFVSGLSNGFDKCHSQIMRRLSDLKNKGLVVRIGAAGEGEVRWYPVICRPAR